MGERLAVEDRDRASSARILLADDVVNTPCSHIFAPTMNDKTLNGQ